MMIFWSIVALLIVFGMIFWAVFFRRIPPERKSNELDAIIFKSEN